MSATLKQFVNDLLRNEEYEEVISDSLFHSENIEKENSWDSDAIKEFRSELKEANVIFEYVDNYGGEGQGDDYWSVYSFTRGDEKVYVKFNGWYASYNGSEYNEWFFVDPREKTIIVYDRSTD